MGQRVIVRISSSVDDLAAAVAAAISAEIANTLKRKAYFDLVLAGGETPRSLYQYLAEYYPDSIPWGKINFFWSDERWVPHDDPESNYRMARETLLDHVQIDSRRVFPIPTGTDDPISAAASYESLLKTHFDSEWPHFDLMLLGLGRDCHVASLFPGSDALRESKRWVVPSISEIPPAQRLTLSLPAINGSVKIYFMVAGIEKAVPISSALSSGQIPVEDCPARGVSPTDGEVIWWLDNLAAALTISVRGSS